MRGGPHGTRAGYPDRATLLRIATRVADVARGVDPDDPDWESEYEPDPHTPEACPVCNRVADIIAAVLGESEAASDQLLAPLRALVQQWRDDATRHLVLGAASALLRCADDLATGLAPTQEP